MFEKKGSLQLGSISEKYSGMSREENNDRHSLDTLNTSNDYFLKQKTGDSGRKLNDDKRVRRW